ncbi:MAG: hypothetical protein ACREJC_09205, partial [Tepidisphaeraceae bacterium]
ASLWLLVRGGLVSDPRAFICPSSSDAPDSLTDSTGKFVKPVARGNFRRARNLSYSYATPFSNAPGYRMDDTRKSDFAILADMNPGISRGDDITGPSSRSSMIEQSKANSNNHNKAGQNVLYADGSVSFERTPYVGVGRSHGVPGDNIYTALSATPLNGQTPPADGNGYWSPQIGPAWASDSYLVPTDDEGPQ